MNRRHAITPVDSFDRWRETNPGYVTGAPRRVRIPHRKTGEPVECVEIDACKAIRNGPPGPRGAAMTFAGKSLTKADLARRAAIHAGECMACLQRGIRVAGTGVVQWHHTAGKKRHDLTCGLCCWHHVARPWPDRTHAWCRDVLGPSLAEGSKPFHAEFGSDDALLAMQNELLKVAA